MQGLNILRKLWLLVLIGISASVMAAVDINTASVDELQQLKGIGPKKAADIVAYREAHGAFKSVAELEQVKGIGKATIEKLGDEIIVGSVAASSKKSADKGGAEKSTKDGDKAVEGASDKVLKSSDKAGKESAGSDNAQGKQKSAKAVEPEKAGKNKQ